MAKKDDPIHNIKVEEIEKYPCLYNHKLPDYSKRDVTDLAWESVAKSLKDKEYVNKLFTNFLDFLSECTLIDNDKTVEIKCPYSSKDYGTLEQAVLEKKGQMHITKRTICYFFMYTPKWTHLEVIKYNEHFWSTKMEPMLKLFYEECLLTEIIDPQYCKRLLKSDIIDPPYIIENIKKSQEKKSKSLNKKKI